jgi:hypothetical protein
MPESIDPFILLYKDKKNTPESIIGHKVLRVTPLSLLLLLQLSSLPHCSQGSKLMKIQQSSIIAPVMNTVYQRKYFGNSNTFNNKEASPTQVRPL